MYKKNPHISIANIKITKRVLGIGEEEILSWPQYTRETVEALCSEMFLIRYNPFIPPEVVRKSVFKQLEDEKGVVDEEIYNRVHEGLSRFWDEFIGEQEFKKRVISRLKKIISPEHIYTAPNNLVECSTDATDLRVELPMFIVAPASTYEVQKVVEMANEMRFHIVPRGGGSGLTGGAVPARPRTVVLSLSRLKDIKKIDKIKGIMCLEAGVITLNAIKAASREGLLFTVDPASKASSSIGGNISENAGGPFAFEYGTTLDNILSYKMVLPSGHLVEVRRKDHPRHKILPEEEVVFEVYGEDNTLLNTIRLKGNEIRGAGLGKDVTNKYLGGLPGVQKEGVDGIITEACFVVYEKLPYSSTLCLEFYGNTMENAMHVIKELVELRDRIRKNGDRVKMSALEEFGAKYVQAIEYQKKSSRFEGDPISVLLIQLDSKEESSLEEVAREIESMAKGYPNVDVFIASSEKEAEIFWEDRHKLSAIARRTSGFKINEDVVIPLGVIPEFSKFIEELNLYYLALAYRRGLEEVIKLDGIDPGDEFVEMEINFSSSILKGKIGPEELPEQEFLLQIHFFFRDLKGRYPHLRKEIEDIEQQMLNTRITIANHMHAGDGNCHVNIPVNSNDAEMLKLAEEAASRVFEKVLQLGGAISGEHGIGITKISFLDKKRIEELQRYKKVVDPNNIFNPDKLTRRSLEFVPYTFSFNKLIQDLSRTSIPHKEKLISILKNIQICSRCGKCKQVCPMYYPEEGYLYHPRNKIISIGALLEAYYYLRIVENKPNRKLLKSLKDLADRCTSCGKCMEMCPVKINTGEQILELRGFMEERTGLGSHPIKSAALHFLSTHPRTIPLAASLAAIGQGLNNRIVNFLPEEIKERSKHPLLIGKGPELSIRSVYSTLRTKKNNYISPAIRKIKEDVFYFPGCGAGLFFPSIAEAAIYLLLKLGVGVILPRRHMCCGYPLLASGLEKDFEKNRARNIREIEYLTSVHHKEGREIKKLLTSCGTCREAISSYGIQGIGPHKTQQRDVVQYIIEMVHEKGIPFPLGEKIEGEWLLLHIACHVEWDDISPLKAGEVYKRSLEGLLKKKVHISEGCCGESGLGALTTPSVYHTLREKKKKGLKEELRTYPMHLPVLVGCPSCKVGIIRIVSSLQEERKVLHILEYLAYLVGGASWQRELYSLIK